MSRSEIKRQSIQRGKCVWERGEVTGWWDAGCGGTHSLRGFLRPQGKCRTCGKEIIVLDKADGEI